MRASFAILAVVALAAAPLAAAAPEAPRMVQVVAVGDAFALIAWTPVPGADLYLVYRGTGPGDMQQIDSTELTHYLDELAPAAVYGIVVVDDGEKSPLLIVSSTSSGGDCVSANSNLHVAVTVANCVRQ